MEFSSLNGYKVKDKKAIRSYDTVTLMKADNTLKEGQHVKTKGYYEVGDGGHGEYIIRAINDDIIDEGFIISLSNENLVGELIIDNELKLKQLGLQSTDEDISTALQNAIDKSYNNFSILVDDLYNLKETITINRPVIIKGKISEYSNWGNSGFICYGDKLFFLLYEGTINSTFEQLIFKGSKTHDEGYEGTCIRFSSRNATLTDYRVWKNMFLKCHFTGFDLALDFYATGTYSDYDYSSEILFLHCKFLNNNTNIHFANKQSYNINFISSDLESWYGSTGCVFNTLSGINFNGCSIILRGDFLKAERNESLTPNTAFGGLVNVTSCRFEIITLTEKVFNLNMIGGTYPGVSGDNHFSLNVTDCDFLIHAEADGSTLLHTNLQGLMCTMKGIVFTGADSRKMKINLEGSQGITEYSRILIYTPNPKRLELETNTTGNAYKPWLIINDSIISSCASAGQGNNYYEINDKLHLGYNKGSRPTEFNIFVPWYYKKFKINISGGFMGNTGTITIKNSDNTFTETFTKSTNNLADTVGEILLPYKENGDTYTITVNNIWGNCYFEK